MLQPSVWVNDKQDVVIAAVAPNASYWRVFTGANWECARFVRSEA